jgi:hypothetical protein
VFLPAWKKAAFQLKEKEERKELSQLYLFLQL